MEEEKKERPAVIPPTVGRIVLFRYDETNTFPAIITRVHDESLVSLMVFKDFVCEAMTSRYHGENIGQWDWMPFQKDQQKRAELMAEKIAEEKGKNPLEKEIVGPPEEIPAEFPEKKSKKSE